jgi:hypothetical protein
MTRDRDHLRRQMVALDADAMIRLATGERDDGPPPPEERRRVVAYLLREAVRLIDCRDEPGTEDEALVCHTLAWEIARGDHLDEVSP